MSKTYILKLVTDENTTLGEIDEVHSALATAFSEVEFGRFISGDIGFEVTL